MSNFSFKDRDKPRLSERLRGKSGDELFKELRKELEHDRKSFFDTPSQFGTSTGSFPRAGHFFDDPLMRGQTDIRSHLEDLAKRHPEFADQLRYPAWSNDSRNNTWGHKQRSSGTNEESSQQQPPEQSLDTQPQTETTEEPVSLRGRAKDNLRNTVPDMGQKQQEAEEKDSRGQRSWSAPPDSRAQQPEKPRFISKIEINPVNPDASQTQGQTGNVTKPPMAPPKPQPQPQPHQQQQQQSQTQPKQSQPNVRHIPIFVEGRDEPVIPKNIEPELTQTQAPPQHFSRPPPQSQFTSSQHHFQPQGSTRKQQTPPCNEVPQASPYEQQAPMPQPSIQPEQQQPESSPVNPKDPLYRVGLVQKEVDNLKILVDEYSGHSRSDKEYIILDEFLTRNLIKLDDIDTEGKEEVRAARKNTIKSIQRCISVLENKVPLGSGERKETEEMEVNPDSTSEVKSEVVSEGSDPNITGEPVQFEAETTNGTGTDMQSLEEIANGQNKDSLVASQNNA